MWVLAVEWSSSLRSVALVDRRAGATVALSIAREVEKDATPTALVQELLRTRSIAQEDISSLAIGIGPGSYTGIRSGIALCLGWIASRNIPIVPIRSDRAVALRYLLLEPNTHDHVFVASYAQRESYALADFKRKNETLVENEPLGLAPLETLNTLLRQKTVVLGIDIERRCPGATPVFPRAEDIGRLALTEGMERSPESIQPIYLREASFKKAPPPRVIPDIIR